MKILLTGASGAMGQESLKAILAGERNFDLLLPVMDTDKDRTIMRPYVSIPKIQIVYGNLTDPAFVTELMKGIDLVIHIAAFVSPAADYDPTKAMQVNFGSMKNLISAIYHWGQETATKLVSIGTVAQTGDRMPGLHWGRVGDPIKPSIFDYYAVSKVAAERYLIESGLSYWVSLRQTGMMGPAMASIRDAIIFHNCLDNVLEYVSDRDSGRMIAHLCQYEAAGSLAENFWNHVYNIGGGESCRVSTYELFQAFYGGKLGFSNLDNVINPKLYATQNFHGHYYLDSDILENFLHFQSDSIDYFYSSLEKNVGWGIHAIRLINKLPGGQKLLGKIIQYQFKKIARTRFGTLRFIEDNLEPQIEAYWGNRDKWKSLPNKLSDMEHFTAWSTQQIVDHGYDESKSPEQLDLEDLRGAAVFRGGECLSSQMEKGNWSEKLHFRCAFGHEFTASPKLVLEAGHFCPVCESSSWNYGERAKREPFLAQVWSPHHDPSEVREYPKIVSEKDVD